MPQLGERSRRDFIVFFNRLFRNLFSKLLLSSAATLGYVLMSKVLVNRSLWEENHGDVKFDINWTGIPLR